MTFQDAQPRATAIKQAVLARTMPPWGAIKGFGDFRNDNSLTQDQIELITDWVEGGTLKGNNPNALPAVPKFEPERPFIRGAGIDVTGELTLTKHVTLDGLIPQHVPKGTSLQVVATLPNGMVEPLVWLYEFDDAHRHPFLFRKPIMLPSGTVVHGVRPPARLTLLESGHESSH